MKKIIATLCILAMILVLSACAGGNNPKITADEALNIALEQAGVTRQQITNLKSYLDREDGRLVYEIDFDANGVEYSYDINAKTGAVVERDRDIED